jgi:hypothetical protein
MMDEESLRKAKEAIKAIETDMKSTLHIQEKLNQGLGNQIKALQDIGKIEALLKKAQQDRNKLQEEYNKNQARYEDKLRDQEAERLSLAADLKSIDADVVRNAKTRLKQLDEEIKDEKSLYAISVASLKNHDKIVEAQKEQLALLKKAVKESNQYLATWNTLKGVPGMFFKGFSSGMNILKPLFEMDKEIRNAARSMNILGEKNFKSFANGLERAAEKTVTMGVNVKDLAIMQRNYSEQIGKSVELTDDGNIAMAQMSEGTGLGAEFATQMAAEMDKFGASASAARDLVSDTIKKASRMGVNGAAASKKLISLLKLSQTYVFKGGVKALSSMANDAERLRLDLEGAAGLAEKVMRPEGAVETAALLTTMGGEFGKLGDPFQLMFKSRNDFAGFTKDIGKATAEFIDFNKETGAFEIKGGLARDRMKEISTITGIQMDKLQEMGEAQRKIQMINEKAGGMFSEDDAALLGTLAQVDSNGDIKIKFRGQDAKNLSQVNQGMIEAYKKQSINLEKSAEQARTFDEVISDFIMSFKQQLLPFVQQLKDRFGVPIQNFIKTLTAEGFYTKLREAAGKFGEYAGKLWDFAKVVLVPIGKLAYSIAKFVVDNPIGSLVTFLGGWALLKAATWYGNGLALGAGFNSVAGGPMGMLKGSIGMLGKAIGVLAVGLAGWKLGDMLGGAMTEARGQKSTKEGSNIGMWTAGGAALAGAAIGSAFGGVGAIPGYLIGAGIGAFLGGTYGKTIGDAYNQPSYEDAVVYGNNSKQIAKGVKFHPNDKFVSVNDAVIAGTDKGGVERAAQRISEYKHGNSINKLEGNISHDGSVKHEGVIKLEINGIGIDTGLIVDYITNNPAILNKLTAGVNESNNKNSSGGVPRGNSLGFNIA